AYFLLRRVLYRWVWKTQRHLHRPRTIDVSVDGVKVVEELSQHFYAWPAFHKFAETPNLFLLYSSAMTFVMLPKRAISDEQQSALRNMASYLVLHLEDARRGFAVAASGQ